MTIKSASKTAYDTDNLDVVTNVKNLLEYGDDSWRSVAKKTGFGIWTPIKQLETQT